MRDYFKFRWAVLSTLMLSLALFGAQAAAAQTGTVQRDVGLTVYDMAWSPDGEWLALALEDGIGIYSPGLEEIARIPISSVVIDVSWSPDSTRLASVNIEDLPLKIWHWDAAAGTLALERAMARGDLDASPDGRGSVVVPEGENQVYVYEHPFLDGAEWSPDGNWLALMISRPVSRSNNFSSAVEIWDTHTWTPRNTLPDEHLFSAGVIAWSPDNRRIALIGNACINDEFIYCDMTYFYIDDTVSGELLYENNGIFELYQVLWSGSRLAVASLDRVSIFDTTDYVMIASYPNPWSSGVNVDWLSNGRDLVIARRGGRVEIIDTETMAVLLEFETAYLRRIDLSPDDRKLAILHDQTDVIEVRDVRLPPNPDRGAPTVTPLPTPTITPTPSPYPTMAL